MLSVKNLHVDVEGKEVVKGVSFDVRPGEVVVLMGPNGSGKSSIALSLAGHPNYIASGSVTIDGKDLLSLKVHERSHRGLFVGFQNSESVPGVSISSFLRAALTARLGKPISLPEFRKRLRDALDALQLPESFAERPMNEGFSGGEKKRCEVLQLLVLRPKIAILDETDSGLDVDGLKIVAEALKNLVGPDFGCLVITHHRRLIELLPVDRVILVVEGKILKEGSRDIAYDVDLKGFKLVSDEHANKSRTG
jgi:Fe-S cluster assembly ATP-binding protein